MVQTEHSGKCFVNIGPGQFWSTSTFLWTYCYPTEGLELQIGEVLCQLLRLQVIKQQGNFSLLTAVSFYSLGDLPGPFSGISKNKQPNRGVQDEH